MVGFALETVFLGVVPVLYDEHLICNTFCTIRYIIWNVNYVWVLLSTSTIMYFLFIYLVIIYK
jgi:hypothetical protein